MSIPHLDHRPSPEELRTLARSTTVRPVKTCWFVLSQDDEVLANATGWAPGWRAAAVYLDRGLTYPDGSRRPHRAILVLGSRSRETRRVQWYEAPLCTWEEP